MVPTSREQSLIQAGVDEAGRGPLAGPVVAGAVILSKGFPIQGLGDSKALTPRQRFSEEARILEHCRCAVAFVWPEEIDRINILQATFAAMRSALAELGEPCDEILIDGNQVPPGLGVRARAIIKGDATVPAISAASILAKCARDRYMVQAHEEFPGYGFANHFGYGTPEHLAAIAKLGPCPLHRLSFAPLKIEEQLCLTLDQ